jgi:tetratricopeptide (TPR) repeat protein
VKYRLGWQKMREEAWEDAARAFQDAIVLNPKWADAHYSLGRARMALRKYPEAIQAYVTCREILLARVGTHFANQIEANRFRQDRIMEYREELKAAQQGPQAQTQRGQQTTGQLNRSIRFLEDDSLRNTSNLTMDSVPFYVSLALGSAYFRAERWADAEREYKAAIEANSSSGESFSNLAVLYMTTDRLDEAKTAIEAAKRTGFKVNPQLEQDIKDKRRTP